jgi:hypothetical protein
MEVFNFLNTVITSVPEYMRERPVIFGIAVIFMLLYTLVTLGLAWKSASEYEGILPKALYMLINILACAFIYSIAFVFLIADEIMAVNPEIISNRFLLESIVVIVLYVLLLVTVIRIAENNSSGKDTAKAKGTVFWLVLWAGIAVLFIFTEAELALQEWGFSMFGKRLGQWMFNAYFAILLSYLMDFAKEIAMIPFLKIFGNPFIHLEEFIDE